MVGWIDWPGGECPVERGTHVEVRFRDGAQAGGHHPAHFFDILWRHAGMHRDNDIIAYRIVEPKA